MDKSKESTIRRKGRKFNSRVFTTGVLPLLLLVTAWMQMRCGNVEKIAVLSDTIRFEAAGHDDIVTAFAVASEQRLYVRARIKEGRWTSTEATRWLLVTQSGTRNSLISTDTHRTDNGVVKTLVYEPVHSPRAFTLHGLRGDIEDTYQITFPGSESKPVVLITDPEPLMKTNRLFGTDAATTPYCIALKKLANSNMITASVNGRSHHFSESEILMNGLWMKLQAHHRHDTLRLTLRMVNQSGEEVALSPARFRVISHGLVYAPTDTLSASMDLANGRRTQISSFFPLPVTDTVFLDVSAIRIKGYPSAMIHEPIPLVRSYRD